MSLQWKSFLRPDRHGQSVRIIWTESASDVYEIHVAPQGEAVLYVNSREVARSRDILGLCRDAERMTEAMAEVA